MSGLITKSRMREKIPEGFYIQNRKQVIIDKDLGTLMLSIAANRILVHHGHRHFCKLHTKIIDRQHIDDCNILNNNSAKKVTHYNTLL